MILFSCSVMYKCIASLLIGNYANFENFINKKKPVVFTSEDVDPYVCGHQAGRCSSKVSEVYKAAGVPMEINGEKCKTFKECNSKSHGPLPE